VPSTRRSADIWTAAASRQQLDQQIEGAARQHHRNAIAQQKPRVLGQAVGPEDKFQIGRRHDARCCRPTSLVERQDYRPHETIFAITACHLAVQ
jgi:hypothetical protein